MLNSVIRLDRKHILADIELKTKRICITREVTTYFILTKPIDLHNNTILVLISRYICTNLYVYFHMLYPRVTYAQNALL